MLSDCIFFGFSFINYAYFLKVRCCLVGKPKGEIGIRPQNSSSFPQFWKSILSHYHHNNCLHSAKKNRFYLWFLLMLLFFTRLNFTGNPRKKLNKSNEIINSSHFKFPVDQTFVVRLSISCIAFVSAKRRWTDWKT